MANTLVTGGAGFIGSHLVEHLLDQGEAVRVLDNFLTGRRENLAPFLNRIELIEGDLRDPKACARAVEDMDFVLHPAALPSVPRSLEDPVESTEINVMGTTILLHECVKAGVKRVVYSGSSSAYGDQPGDSKDESLLPMPLSPYAASKLACEYLCQAFSASFGLSTVTIRYFNVFGPRQDPDSPYSAVIPLFINAMLAGERPTIFGDGTQSRDFTYVENVVAANMLAIHAEDHVSGKTYNAACGGSFTLLDLVGAINQGLGTSIEPKFVEGRAGEVMHSKADIGRAREDLGYDVKVDFAEGLGRTIDWYRAESGAS